MRKAIFAALAAAVILLAVSCGQILPNDSLEGTWTSRNDIRTMSYTFRADGTFRYLLKDSKTGAEVTAIEGTWEITPEGLLHMNAPIEKYVSRYTEEFARFVIIYDESPTKYIYFGSADDPDYIDESFYSVCTIEAENTYSFQQSTEGTHYGVPVTTDSTKRFEFDPENGKCIVTISDEMVYENGTYLKSTKQYNYTAQSYDVPSYIAYKLYNEIMFSEEELMNYTLLNNSLLLGSLNVLLTRE